MSQVDFIIKIDGSDIEKGLDLFEFAPSLLALGNVVREASKVSGAKKNIGINIKPIERGSFLIELAFFAQNGVDGLFTLLKNDDVKNIKELLEWIGLIAGGSFSLLEFIKWREKNKNPAREIIEPNKIKYTENDQSVTVNGIVENLYNNATIHQYFYPALKTLERDGVDIIESYVKGEENNKTILKEKDIRAIKKYSESEIQTSEEIGEESIYETSLNFKRGSFEGEPTHWSFRKGEQNIVAVIKDEMFLEKIRCGDIRPYTKDFLRVRVKETPKLVGTEIRSVLYEILEVKEYKKYEENKLFQLPI